MDDAMVERVARAIAEWMPVDTDTPSKAHLWQMHKAARAAIAAMDAPPEPDEIHRKLVAAGFA